MSHFELFTTFTCEYHVSGIITVNPKWGEFFADECFSSSRGAKISPPSVSNSVFAQIPFFCYFLAKFGRN